MPDGKDPRSSGSQAAAGTEPTLHDTEAEATPRAAVGTPVDDLRDSGLGDTAVASRSERMAAQNPSDVGVEADEETRGDTIVGSVLAGRYEITRQIGQGGMGAVYEATHKLIGKRVAVKVLLDKYAERDQIVARLEQEARLASSIGHEHIIDITDFGQTNDGRTFVVMEYLEGESLAELLEREGTLPEQRILRIAHQIASALSAAHAKGILHRDVKPENVFIIKRKSTSEFVKVVDFGISKSLKVEGGDSPRLTQTGMVLGTPLYMSPEQARGDDELDERIDVYALGVIMYELATGEVPFQGNNYLNIISQVLNDDPVPPRDVRPDLSPEFEAVCLKALAKEVEDRYESADELDDDLLALIEDPGRTTSRARMTASRFRRKKKGGIGRYLAFAGLAAAVALGVAIAVPMMMGSDDNKTKDEPLPVASVVPDAQVATKAPVDAGPPVPQLELAEIEIVTVPSGADIFHEGRKIGTSPTMLEAPLQNDKIKLIAVLDGHNDTEFTVNPFVDDGKSAEVHLKKPKKGEKVKKIKRPKPPKNDDPPKIKTQPVDKKDDTAGGELGGNPYD